MQISRMQIKVWILCLSLAALLAQPVNGLAQIQSIQPTSLQTVQQVEDWTFTVIARDTNGSLGVASVSDSGELLLTQNDGTKYNLLLWSNGVFDEITLPEGVSFYSGAYRKPNAEIAFRGYCGNPYISTCLRKTDGSVVLVNTGEGSSNFDFTNNGWWLLENYLGNSTRRVWATDGFTQTPSADIVLNEYLSNGGAVRFIVGIGPDGAVVVMEQVWDAVQSISRLRTADGADTRLFVC